MKQRGFTLTETLVALAIIGVIAAVTLPMANRFRPDNNKVLYLNSYDSLTMAISELKNNKTIYPEILTIGNSKFVYTEIPFANVNDVADFTGHKIEGGRNKLCRALAESFNIVEDVNTIANDTSNACNNTYSQYNDTDDFVRSFTNKNGVEFMVRTSTNVAKNAIPINPQYRTDVVIDVNGSAKGPNCTWDANCSNPDRFTLKILASGEVYATDSAGIYYLENRKTLGITNIDENNEIQNLLNTNKSVSESIEINDSNGPQIPVAAEE